MIITMIYTCGWGKLPTTLAHYFSLILSNCIMALICTYPIPNFK
ncbi:hypothetical protein LINPERHAP1_LOCUS1441 [Linum perenne]